MEIECKFGVVDWTGNGNFYTCTVKSPSITKRGTKVTSCKGVHQAGKSNADVEAIYFNKIVVEYFPMGLHEIFPNLKLFSVYNCGLKEISRRDLMGLENLTTLWLGDNQLKSLPDNLLNGMTKLTSFSFRNNKIEFVSSDLLQPIKNNKLIRVNFEGNPTKIGRFEPGSSGSLGSLQELCDVIDKNCMKPIGTRPAQAVEPFPERTVKGFKELWTSGRLSDFVVVCGSKEFKVHKLVLANQSSVLAAAVESNMQESKTGRMEIKDFSKEAVENFLKFMYAGETPGETNAMEIFALASKYDVPELQFLMEEIVLQNIDETNAVEILTMANQHNCEFLAQAAFQEIQLIFPEAELDPSLVDNPEKLKQLIDARSKNVRVQIDAKRESERLLIDAKREYERLLNDIEREYERVMIDSERKYEEVLKSCSRMKN